ncbi:Dos2-interacting transcription regulator of RNA-Pol-II-domain-containing protein [Truncatella angustata]|uniref:MMS19 nucleotide excision repair protein n=1 Tax=Truncatella angustata TaxID=152316 RepID=A0A9P8UVZ9_9PEZI|nr:Dos2-interacting transcription regulator of RNA-Pol-II-domain-containing protein [Truncatella angustata]KAH6660294.1 Dos2-interacting transcription regulator of RNA-Pol-II-domain-containing protein [Truncatella angustata]KAH8202687.1 hypothetical protein TruAng_003173 [Truncatella angustata]
MATNPFDDLALRYVLADDGEEPTLVQAAKAAVAQIEAASATSPAATRNAVGQWVASINRWLAQKDDDDDDDIISRAKALGFLARTLEYLDRDLLKADQVKLLIRFFCSLFSSDHRAGIEASSKALGYIAGMKNFQPTSGNDIISGIIKLGSDDFKRQTPATRLEIYRLVHGLLQDAMVAGDLAYQHGSTAGFMTALVDLCKNERDPQNLIAWFEIQALFLQNFEPMDEVTEEVFKTFSAYFPITLRASATPSGITVDDLKRSLRSCFSAHHRVARLAVPFLLNKLDQGEAVTMSVKVDILQTLEACLAQYGNVKQGVSPYSDKIWTSLKYEVRNGEIRDSVEATLKTIATLARRLDDLDLQSLFAAAWIDLSDDISNESYTESAGQLLAAISGASRESFSLASKQSIPYIVAQFKHTKSALHQTRLLGILNAILQVRTALLSAKAGVDLQDNLFDDSLFDQVYARSWEDWTQTQYSNDRPAIIAKLIDGMASLVAQMSGDGTNKRLCSDYTCDRVFNWLGTPSVISVLEEKYFLPGSQDSEHEKIVSAATTALSKLTPLYPDGFVQLLERFLSSIAVISKTITPSKSQADSIRDAGAYLYSIGCSAAGYSPFRNALLVITALLQAFDRLEPISPYYWSPFIEIIRLAMSQTFDAFVNIKGASLSDKTTLADWIQDLEASVNGLANIDKDDVGDLTRMSESLSKLNNEEESHYKKFLIFSLMVVSSLYKHTLRSSLPIGLKDHIQTAPEAQKGPFLYQLGQLAATAIRFVGPNDQINMKFAEQAFVLFMQTDSSMESLLRDVAVVGDEQSKEKWALCKDTYQTAPLVLGILQGLWPTAMNSLYSHGVLLDLCERLTALEPKDELSAYRPVLNNILAILANKFTPSSTSDTLEPARRRLLHPQGDSFMGVIEGTTTQNAGATIIPRPDPQALRAIFSSIVSFLAGDVANYKPRHDENWLLRWVIEVGAVRNIIGPQLAQGVELLVSPNHALQKQYHANVKRLRGQWIYQQTVVPYIDQCFPRQATAQQGAIDDSTATNRSVAIICILKHLDYTVWRSESNKILLVVIRSLQKFGTGKDINTVMDILLKIVNSEADLVKDHLNTLITHVLAVYGVARNAHESLNSPESRGTECKMTRREAAVCRKYCLVFLEKLPKTFESVRHNLIPQRRAVLRQLSRACGDPVREVRSVAIHGRAQWEALS